MKTFPAVWIAVAAVFMSACNRPAAPTGAGAPPTKHEHVPPHGGTPVELGQEEFHVELVRDARAGRLTAYVMDGELEKFVRLAEPSLALVVKGPGGPTNLVLRAIANAATGETVGDTAQFDGEADWIKDRAVFDAEFPLLKIRGHAYSNVGFNFPKGNDGGDR
jgi:hypothetical protein